MSSAANQIVQRTPVIVRGTVVLADGMKAVSLAQRIGNTLVLPSGFEVQNLGADALQLWFDNSGVGGYKTIRKDAVYPLIPSSAATVYVSTTGAAEYEFVVYLDAYR